MILADNEREIINNENGVVKENNFLTGFTVVNKNVVNKIGFIELQFWAV